MTRIVYRFRRWLERRQPCRLTEKDDAGRAVGAPTAVFWGMFLLVGALLLPASAGAQQVPGEKPATATVESPVGEATWHLSLERTEVGEDDEVDASIAVRLRPDGEPLAEFAVPEWAKPPAYELQAQAAEITDDQIVVLAEVVPSPDTPAGSTKVRVQLALRGQLTGATASNPNAWDWSSIGRAQYSSLDGGTHFEFRESGGTSRLIRTRPNASSSFCGSSDAGDVVTAVFRPEQGKFVEIVHLEQHLKDATKLQATLPTSPLTGPFTRGAYQWFWATSNLASHSGRDGNIVRPMALDDRRGSTAWRVDASEGLRGEFATANVTDAVPIRALHIVPGYTKSAESYRTNRLPKRLLLSFSDGSTFTVEVPQVDYERLTARRGLVIELPEPIQTHCLSVVHLESHPAARPGEYDEAVAISELTPISVVDAPTAEQTAEQVVEYIAGEPDLRERRRLAHMASRLSDHLVEAVKVALEETDGQRRRRIIPVLAQLPADEAVPVLIEFLRELDTDAVEYRAVKRSLAAHHRAAAEPLLEVLAEMKPDNPKYVDVVRLLGRVGEPTDLVTLVEDFGKGDRMVRNERIRATAAGGEAVLSKLFAVAAVESSRAKQRDALKAIYLIGKRQNQTELISTPHPEAIEEVIRRAETRRTLMLAFRVARFYRVEGFPEMVQQRFLDHDDALVRKSAISALARYPSPQARRILEEALSDKSPDVRIAAVTAIRHRKDRTRSADALLRYASNETWRPGQQQAFDALAEIETPKVRKFFHRIIDQRRQSQAAVLAASTLDRAERSIEVELARDVAFDASAPDRLRLEMIDLVGLDDSERGEAFLLTLLNPVELREYVEDQQLRRRFERRALLSLGRRRSERARGRLLKMAKTGSDMKLRQHALRALGFYRGEKLLRHLKAWRPEAPPELRTTLEQTIKIIENRVAIENVDEQIERTLEAEEEKKREENSE